MTNAIVFHEVNEGEVWAKAWQKGPGSRHEMFATIGVKARTFRDPRNYNQTGLLLEIPDLEKFMTLLQTPEGQTAMREDGLKVETMKLLTEFSP